MHHVFFIGTVWPEPSSSAAGTRTLQLIEAFQNQNWKISFASSAQKSEHSFNLQSLEIEEFPIQINSSTFDELLLKIQPSIVVFDRFIIEEQFGWRVTKNCPNALKILDTIDLHCLRNERHNALKANIEFSLQDLLTNDLAKREIASIYRCDFSLMVSEYEMEILENVFKIDASLLHYNAFMFDAIKESEIVSWPKFENRKHFITIGNFLHEPNWDSVLYLKNKIWLPIKKQIPDAELHVFGAYTTQKVEQIHNQKEGFLIKGRCENVNEAMQDARVCLSPLRFGAGIKGKLVDAMLNGTPSITSSIGAESMTGDLPWNGFVANGDEEIIEKAVLLYSQKQIWEQSQKNGIQIINQHFSKKNPSKKLIEKINLVYTSLSEHRNKNFIGGVLNLQTINASKYMSLWIEEKNKD